MGSAASPSRSRSESITSTVTSCEARTVGRSSTRASASTIQGRADYAQCVRAWEGSRGRLMEFMRSHGLPVDEAAKIQADSERLRSRVRYARDPTLLDPGDEVDGWSVLHLPGHADGHLALLR